MFFESGFLQEGADRLFQGSCWLDVCQVWADGADEW